MKDLPFAIPFKAIFPYLILLVAVAFSGVLQSAEGDEFLVSPEGDTMNIAAIPLIEVNERVEAVVSQLNTLTEVVKARENISELDSLLRFADEFLDKEEGRIQESDRLLTLRNVDDYRKQWESYNTELNKWNSSLSDRIKELNQSNFNARFIRETWQKTRLEAREQDAIKETLDKIQSILDQSRNIEKGIKQRQDSVLYYQSKLTDMQLRVSNVLAILTKKKSELQSEYFIQDSPPLWRSEDSTMNAVDVKAQLKRSLADNYKQIKQFGESNSSKNLMHLLLFFILVGILYALRRTFKVPPDKEDQLIVVRTKVVLNQYIASGFLLAVTFSLMLYSNFPTSVRELAQVMLLIPALFLVPRLGHKRLYSIIVYLSILFIIDEIQFFFIGKTLFARILLLFEAAFLIWLVFKFINNKNKSFTSLSRGFVNVTNNFKPILLVLLVFAFVANVLGYVNLATLTSNTLINSILIAVYLLLLVIVLDSFFYSLFSTRLFEHSNIIKFRKETLLKNLHRLFKYLAYFIWIRSVFVSIGIAEQTGNWLVGLFNYTWEFGSVSISFGGILAFFIVLLVTYLFTKLIRTILEDEVFPRVRMGRGVPGAISMVVRYTLIAFGIYVALSAAGIDLDKFGLIAGALGVGIGFGLQGVVYNFIAGLILAFERPIQKGDTIEIGTLMGDVMEIGVRSSTVRTYDGSEVIVPNGNLISNEVVNWTLSDRKRRSVIPVNVAYGSKPRDVMELMVKVVSKHPEVLDFPKPWPLFDGFGDSSLNFRILFWVDFDRRLSVTSEIAMDIYDALEDAGISIPFPQRDLHIKSFDPTVQKTVLPGKGDPGKKKRLED